MVPDTGASWVTRCLSVFQAHSSCSDVERSSGETRRLVRLQVQLLPLCHPLSPWKRRDQVTHTHTHTHTHTPVSLLVSCLTSALFLCRGGDHRVQLYKVTKYIYSSTEPHISIYILQIKLHYMYQITLVTLLIQSIDTKSNHLTYCDDIKKYSVFTGQ